MSRLGWYGGLLCAGCSIRTECGTCCAWLAGYDPCSGQWLLELSRKVTSASGDSRVTDEGMRAVRGLPALTSKTYNTPV